MDLLPPGAPPPAIRTRDDAPVVAISAVSGAGIATFLETLWQHLRAPVTAS
jgi:hypothetical protein